MSDVQTLWAKGAALDEEIARFTVGDDREVDATAEGNRLAVVAEVGTDKANMEAEIFDDGVLITYGGENYPAADIEVTGTQSVTLRNGSLVASLKQDRASPGGNVLIQGGDVTIENSTVAADVHAGESGASLARLYGGIAPPVGGGSITWTKTGVK